MTEDNARLAADLDAVRRAAEVREAVDAEAEATRALLVDQSREINALQKAQVRANEGGRRGGGCENSKMVGTRLTWRALSLSPSLQSPFSHVFLLFPYNNLQGMRQRVADALYDELTDLGTFMSGPRPRPVCWLLQLMMPLGLPPWFTPPPTSIFCLPVIRNPRCFTAVILAVTNAPVGVALSVAGAHAHHQVDQRRPV